MKKLNKKGITLVELIVSFALIAVAVTYFYQTLITVHELYGTSKTETDAFTKKTYALRILDKYLQINGSEATDLVEDINNLTMCSVTTPYVEAGMITIDVDCDEIQTKFFSSTAFLIETAINDSDGIIIESDLKAIAEKYNCSYVGYSDNGVFYYDDNILIYEYDA